MSALRTRIAWLTRWIDDVAQALAQFGGRFRSAPKVQLVEQADGAFLVRPMRKRSAGRPVGAPLHIEGGAIVGTISARTQKLLAGSQIEIMLQPARFVFRPLELPRRAREFLDGVVRAQIDRLTPWSPAEAAFGWSAPAPLGTDRIVVTVAATARAMIAPLVQAASDRGADSIIVSTTYEGADGVSAPIAIFAQRSGAELRVRRLRRKLVALLAFSGVAAAASIAAALVIGGDLDAQQLDFAHRIAERRAALLSGRGSLADEALAALDARKRATPAGVIVIEALSQTLPDDTYLNELRIEEGKVQIAGLTRDAPALIRLIEQSQHFSRATFFAPTTRAPTDSGERFHIEAHIQPIFPMPQ
jgi:general secretion pathway protein L